MITKKTRREKPAMSKRRRVCLKKKKVMSTSLVTNHRLTPKKMKALITDAIYQSKEKEKKEAIQKANNKVIREQYNMLKILCTLSIFFLIAFPVGTVARSISRNNTFDYARLTFWGIVAIDTILLLAFRKLKNAKGAIACVTGHLFFWPLSVLSFAAIFLVACEELTIFIELVTVVLCSALILYFILSKKLLDNFPENMDSLSFFSSSSGIVALVIVH